MSQDNFGLGHYRCVLALCLYVFALRLGSPENRVIRVNGFDVPGDLRKPMLQVMATARYQRWFPGFQYQYVEKAQVQS